MDLTGVLSNTQTEALYERLTRRAWRQVRREAGPLRYIEIHEKVEELLGMPICRSSTKQLLSTEARHRRPLRQLDELRLSDAACPLSPFRDLIEPQIEEQYRSVEPGKEVEINGEHHFAEATWLHLPDEMPIRVTGYRWTQRVDVAAENFSVGFGVGGLAAELVLRSLDGSIHHIFSNRQIQSWVFDGKEVVPRAEG